MPPKIIHEDLWRFEDDKILIAVTTNGNLHMDGSLIMGKGAALEAVKRYPGIEKECGLIADAHCYQYHLDRYKTRLYGFRVIRNPLFSKIGFGIFQVKFDYGAPARLSIIAYSTVLLMEYALEHPSVNIRLNCPGIGNGRLDLADVQPILEMLPENVTVCLYPVGVNNDNTN